jgi:hypothetical protein
LHATAIPLARLISLKREERIFGEKRESGMSARNK